ncbi:hypothetical protein [Roseateles sp. P5_E11]
MKLFIAKIVIAAMAIGAIVLGASSQIAPGIAGWKVLLGAAAFAAVLLSAVLVHAFLVGSLRELLLRWGAIDTQWLWTPDYPEGFKRYWRRGSKTTTE